MFERLEAIRQKGSVEDFIKTSNGWWLWQERYQRRKILGSFLAGLHENIGNQMRPNEPRELVQAMKIARDMEEAFQY